MLLFLNISCVINARHSWCVIWVILISQLCSAFWHHREKRKKFQPNNNNNIYLTSNHNQPYGRWKVHSVDSYEIQIHLIDSTWAAVTAIGKLKAIQWKHVDELSFRLKIGWNYSKYLRWNCYFLKFEFTSLIFFYSFNCWNHMKCFLRNGSIFFFIKHGFEKKTSDTHSSWNFAH